MELLWVCKCCGKLYDQLPFAYKLDEPDPWHALPEAERTRRGELSSDACMIDHEQFFVRGRLVIPVKEQHLPFVWGLWVAVSQQGFERVHALWDVAERSHEPPIPCTLGNDVPIYPATFGLRGHLHLKNAGRRPSIVLEPGDHPLALEQRDGISIERVKEFAAAVLPHSK